MTARNREVFNSVLDQLASEVDPKTQARYEEQKANGVVNPIVLARLLGVRPQMIYNYINKGYIVSSDDDVQAIGSNNTQKKTIDLNVAEGFARKQIDKREAKQARIEAELAGEVEVSVE